MPEDEVTTLFTDWDNKNTKTLRKCGVKVTIRIPDGAEFDAAKDYMDKHQSDRDACFYIMKHHMLEPNVSDLPDQKLKDMVDHMHPLDIQRVIFMFFDIDAVDMREDMGLEALRERFREEGQEQL